MARPSERIVEESETLAVSYATSILSASSRLASMACLAMRRSSSCRPLVGGVCLGLSPQGSEIFFSERWRDSGHPSSRSHITAPTRRVRDPTEGGTCTTRLLRLVSPSVPSRASLALGPSRRDWGRPRWARASGSASPRILAALGRHLPGTSHAGRYVALTWPASLARKTGATIRATRRLSCWLVASLTQSRIRCTTHRCQAAPRDVPRMALLSPSWASAPKPHEFKSLVIGLSTRSFFLTVFLTTLLKRVSDGLVDAPLAPASLLEKPLFDHGVEKPPHRVVFLA